MVGGLIIPGLAALLGTLIRNGLGDWYTSSASSA